MGVGGTDVETLCNLGTAQEVLLYVLSQQHGDHITRWLFQEGFCGMRTLALKRIRWPRPHVVA